MIRDNSAISPVVASIEAENLSVVLGGQRIIDIPSFRVFPNEVLAIIGPNGSGKTTLLLALAALLKPEKDNCISYWGQPVKYGSDILRLRRQFAVLFQDPLLLSGNAWNNVTLGLRMRGVKKEEINLRTKKWMERFGIVGLAKRQVKTLSGGEAKRVSLARAFVLQPEILFLDEPFAALDSPTRAALLEDFESVLRETRVTTVMVTHESNEAIVLANRVAILMKGRLRQVGTPKEVFSCPVDEEVADFIEVGNIIHGIVVSQNAGLASVAVNGINIDVVSGLAPGTDVIMFLRHEDITLSLLSEHVMQSSARNQLPGKVVKVFPTGSQIRITLDCGFPLVSIITTRSYEEMGLAPGKDVISTFKATAVRLIIKTK